MPDFLTQLGIEKFSDQVADKVIERGSDKIAAAVVRQIEPILKQPATAPKKEKLDPFLTRKEVAQLLNISDPTLRQKYKSGELKVYGSGTRHMRFDPADVRLYLENS